MDWSLLIIIVPVSGAVMLFLWVVWLTKRENKRFFTQPDHDDGDATQQAHDVHYGRMEQLGFKAESGLRYKCSMCGVKYVANHNICPLCNKGSLESIDGGM